MQIKGALAALLTSIFLPPALHAEGITVTQSQPISEFWLNPGLYSLHFQRDKGLNDNNIGIGFEYRYSTVSSVTAGVIDNSDRKTSRYAGWYWQPLALGPVRLGGVAGAMDGYPKFRDGGWFPVVLPAASVEYKRVGRPERAGDPELQGPALRRHFVSAEAQGVLSVTQRWQSGSAGRLLTGRTVEAISKTSVTTDKHR